MGFEASHEAQFMQDRAVAEALVNTASEALISASNLELSVLEGDRYVLESELEEIFREAMVNNLPHEALGEGFSPVQNSRRRLYFIPRKGGYLSLNRKIRATLKPNQLRRIRTLRGMTLSDFVKRYYKMSDNTPLTFDVNVFQAKSGLTRPFRITRANLGGTRPIHLNQLHPMTKRFAQAIGAPWLWSPKLRRWYIIRLVRPVLAHAISTRVTSSPVVVRVPTTPTTLSIRTNNISVRIDQLDRFRVLFYLNNDTVTRLRSLAGLKVGELKKVLEDLVSSYGQSWLISLFNALKIPPSISKAISRWLVKLVKGYINRASSGLIQNLDKLANQPNGVTIGFIVQLPQDFVKSVKGITILKLPYLLRDIARISFTLAASPGYKM